MTGASGPPGWRLRLRVVASFALKLACLLILVLVAHRLVDGALLRAEASANAHMLTLGLVAGLLALYAILIAIPFVPGVEIGLALLTLRGAEVAPFVYIATIAGLMLAYGAGRHVPLRPLARRLRDLRLHRAPAFLDEIESLDTPERIARLKAALPARAAVWAVGWRYPILALLVNLPGSSLIGGGGGICLLAGLTGIFAPRATAVTLAIAVAPVPLAAWWFGMPPGFGFGAR